jgi:hypothetical protein
VRAYDLSRSIAEKLAAMRIHVSEPTFCVDMGSSQCPYVYEPSISGIPPFSKWPFKWLVGYSMALSGDF